MTKLLALSLVLVCGSAALPGARAAEGIWGRTIMKQPFDKTAFREVKVPGWVEDLTTICYRLPGTDDATLARLVKDGVQTGCLFFAEPTHVCYHSKYLKNVSPYYPPEKLEADYAALVKHGIKIIGVVPPALWGEPYFAHPEWRRIGTNTTQIPQADPVKEPYGGPLCLMGPWGDRLIDILEEIVRKYPKVTAWSFDGLHDYGCCYCANCREAYRNDTGKEIPNADMNDPEFRRYVHWLDRRLESFVVRMQTRLKSINPDIALITWTTNAGRFGHFLSIPRNMPARMNLLFDCPDQEFWMDETNRGNTVVSAFANAYIWAVTNHRTAASTTYVMSHGNPYDGSSFPNLEYLRRLFLVMTYGPIVTTDKVAEIQSRAPWTTHKQPEPWAAMVMSDNTNCFYGRDPAKDEERYLSNVFGVFRTAVEEHFPMTVINDWNLNSEDLSKYKVLVLPNTAVMNEEQAEAVRQFVKNGGGLVASVDTSLFDEFGDPRKDFLLADLFGVHYKGTAAGSGAKETLDPNFEKAVDAGYWEKRKNIFDFRLTRHVMLDTPALNELVGDRPACFKGQAVAVSADPDADVIGTITSREAGAQPLPAVVVRSYGRGKVAYLAAGFDSAYYLYPYPYQRHILAQAIRWVAPEPPRIIVEAPMCVHSTFYRQSKGGERLIVHLYNDLNSAGNHAKPDDDVPLREEIVPIHDIKVTFKTSPSASQPGRSPSEVYNISRIHLEPGGVDLKAVKTKDGLQVTVPKLEIHSMIVAELD